MRSQSPIWIQPPGLTSLMCSLRTVRCAELEPAAMRIIRRFTRSKDACHDAGSGALISCLMYLMVEGLLVGKKDWLMSVPVNVCVPCGGEGSEDWTSRIQRPSAVPTSSTARGAVEKLSGANIKVPSAACLNP